MRVLVCGGRYYTDYDTVYDYLDTHEDITVIISGRARGADSIAQDYALDRDLQFEGYPADWDRYGKRAGYIRNQQMLDEGKPDLVIAFPGGEGTKMMVELARRANVEVIEVG